jgi:hypothetical protein
MGLCDVRSVMELRKEYLLHSDDFSIASMAMSHIFP